MLEENRFLAVKNLAKDIRQENEKLFESLKNEPVVEAIRKKDEFINSVVNEMDIAFSEGDKGREERKIFRANILIPDDVEFFQSYSKDKNIRNLMNKYSVGIDDIMSKITELNLYSKYIDIFNEEPEEETTEEKTNNFVDEMVNVSSKDAQNLLDEIEDLSNAMEDLDISNKEEKEEKPVSLEPETIEHKEIEEPKEETVVPLQFEVPNDFEDKIPVFNFGEKGEPSFNIDEKEAPVFDFGELKEDLRDEEEFEPFDFNDENINSGAKETPKVEIMEEIKEPNIPDIEIKEDTIEKGIEEDTKEEEIEITDEIENISSAVNEFVDEYTKVKKELDFAQAKVDKFTSEKDELRRQLAAVKEEMDNIRNQKNETEKELEKTKEELDKSRQELIKVTDDNKSLRSQVKTMERTAKQSTDLLKEIYKNIPKKRFNVK